MGMTGETDTRTDELEPADAASTGSAGEESAPEAGRSASMDAAGTATSAVRSSSGCDALTGSAYGSSWLGGATASTGGSGVLTGTAPAFDAISSGMAIAAGTAAGSSGSVAGSCSSCGSDTAGSAAKSASASDALAST